MDSAYLHIVMVIAQREQNRFNLHQCRNL
jgi:hypothetical protein